ncbi:MAG: hypothetical protein KJN70_15255 [Eudoraea sp.]|nr:hypothetical protein [Eudoraea sp.]
MNQFFKILNWLISQAWWKLIITIDVLFVIATIFLTYNYNLPILHYFNLGGELNIASWWSGISLLLASLLSYELFSIKHDKTKFSWLIFSLIFLALYWDEIGSLHERIMQNSWTDYYPYGIAGICLLTYSLVNLFTSNKNKKSGILILFGFSAFGLVVLQEYIEHTLDWPYLLLGLRTGIEEGTELLGIFLCLMGVVLERRKTAASHSLMALIPNPSLMKKLPAILLFGLVLHTLASFWIPNLSDLYQRGNPALLYPVAIYLILSASSLHRFMDNPKDKGKINLSLCLLFLIFSLMSGCYKYPIESLLRFYILHCIQIAGVVFFCFKINDKPQKKIILMLSALILFSVTYENLVASFILSGVISYFISRIFLRRDRGYPIVF